MSYFIAYFVVFSEISLFWEEALTAHNFVIAPKTYVFNVCVCVGGGQSGGEESHDPSSVFLQLYHGSMLAQDTPLLLPNNEVTIHSLVSLNSVAGPLIKQRGRGV